MSDKDFLNHLIATQDKISDRLSSIEQTQAVQHETLKDHTRRSLSNEELVQKYRDETTQTLKPIQQHVAHVEFTLKLVGLVVAGLATVLGITIAVAQLVELF